MYVGKWHLFLFSQRGCICWCWFHIVPFPPVFCLVPHPSPGNSVGSAKGNHFEGLHGIYPGEAPVSPILKTKSTNKSSTVRVYPFKSSLACGHSVKPRVFSIAVTGGGKSGLREAFVDSWTCELALCRLAAWKQTEWPDGEGLPVHWTDSLNMVVGSLSSQPPPFFPRGGVQGSKEAHQAVG